jgi:hypothetical protein
MRIVDPAKLKPPVESVAAFACDPEKLAETLDAVVVDQFSAPGPARLGAFELSDGTTVGVMIHDHLRFAEMLAQLSTNLDSTVAEALRLLSVTPSDVQWLREGIAEAAVIAAIAPAVAVNDQTRAVRVELAREFAQTADEMVLTSSEAHALTLLVLRLASNPHLAATIGDTGIRTLRVSHLIFADGTEVAPLAIYYRLESDISATILDVQREGASDIFVTDQTFLDKVISDLSGRGAQTEKTRTNTSSVVQHRPKTVASAVTDARDLLRRAS